MSPVDGARSPLGIYVLPGRVNNPVDGPPQALQAEAAGLGTVWLSERWEQKDAPTLLGAMAQVTDRVRLGTAIVHPATRHPIVLASMALTMQWLSNGRFVLGLGRGVPGIERSLGTRPVSTEALADVADLLRALWRREPVSYRGPLGSFPELRMEHAYDGAPPPLFTAAIGMRTLAMAGAHYDGVILHPLLTADAVRRSVEEVRGAATNAGRDPADVKVAATVIVAPGMAEGRAAAAVGGRAITYLQVPGFGDLLVRVNGWDPGGLARMRSHPLLAELTGEGLGSMADQRFTLEDLAQVAGDLPEGWISEATAAGSPDQVATRLGTYLEAGADELILHGCSPSSVGPLVEAFRSVEEGAGRGI